MLGPFKGSVLDNPFSKVGILVLILSLALFIWVTGLQDPQTASEADKKLADYAFYAANIGMALIFWPAMYLLVVRMLESITKDK